MNNHNMVQIRPFCPFSHSRLCWLRLVRYRRTDAAPLRGDNIQTDTPQCEKLQPHPMGFDCAGIGWTDSEVMELINYAAVISKHSHNQKRTLTVTMVSSDCCLSVCCTTEAARLQPTLSAPHRVSLSLPRFPPNVLSGSFNGFCPNNTSCLMESS